MISGALLVWYILTFGAVVFVIWDLAVNTPTVGVMKLAWVLVILYTGPIGLFVYLLACRQPLPGSHDAYISAHWKQTVGSMAHCLAGDATGIIISAIIVYHFMLPNGLDLIIEYLSAFIVGLLVFQALFMKAMYGDYWVAVRKTFFSETVSMNMVMVGMFPAMLVLMHILPDGDNPWSPVFWGVMSLASLCGAVTAYPINSWLVRKGFKHGMMSAPSESGMNMDAMKSMDATENHGAKEEGEGEGEEHAMAGPSTGTYLTATLGTFVLMIAAVSITALFVPLRF